MNIDISLPRSWRELTQPQVKYVMSLLAIGFNTDQIKTYCLFRWSGLEVIAEYGKDYLLKKDGKEFLASPLLIQSCTDCLSYLEGIPDYPTNIRWIGRNRAEDVRFNEVPFKKFIVCDNLYQGYLATKREDLLEEMAKTLYRQPKLKVTNTERISVFYWWASLKQYFASEFHNFFSGATSGKIDGKSVKKAMNAQIRALTKGDITKEKEVLAMDTWRALTELDALALEYQELERKYPNKKQ